MPPREKTVTEVLAAVSTYKNLHTIESAGCDAEAEGRYSLLAIDGTNDAIKRS